MGRAKTTACALLKARLWGCGSGPVCSPHVSLATPGDWITGDLLCYTPSSGGIAPGTPRAGRLLSLKKQREWRDEARQMARGIFLERASFRQDIPRSRFFAGVQERESERVERILLVSRSPRRKALLELLSVPVEVVAPPDEEGGVSHLPPPHAVMVLAARKVRWALPLSAGTLAIGADTTVVVEGTTLGKPRNLEEARHFLQRLSGRWHWVYTGVALCWGKTLHLFYEGTAVRFHKLSQELIETYLATGSSLDKAGGYGAQDLIGLVGIAEIQGDFYNVMGLPVQRIYQEGCRLLGGTWGPADGKHFVLG